MSPLNRHNGVPNPDESGCCPAQVTDCSWANREGLGKKAKPEKKKWRPQPDLNPAPAGRERLQIREVSG